MHFLNVCFQCFRKGDRIYHQLKKLGGSYDWDRACSPMDPVSVEFIKYIFQNLPIINGE